MHLQTRACVKWGGVRLLRAPRRRRWLYSGLPGGGGGACTCRPAAACREWRVERPWGPWLSCRHRWWVQPLLRGARLGPCVWARGGVPPPFGAGAEPASRGRAWRHRAVYCCLHTGQTLHLHPAPPRALPIIPARQHPAGPVTSLGPPLVPGNVVPLHIAYRAHHPSAPDLGLRSPRPTPAPRRFIDVPRGPLDAAPPSPGLQAKPAGELDGALQPSSGSLRLAVVLRAAGDHCRHCSGCRSHQSRTPAHAAPHRQASERPCEGLGCCFG